MHTLFSLSSKIIKKTVPLTSWKQNILTLTPQVFWLGTFLNPPKSISVLLETCPKSFIFKHLWPVLLAPLEEVKVPVSNTVLNSPPKNTPWRILMNLGWYLQQHQPPGLIFNRGNGGNCLRCPWSLPWCPFKSPNRNLQIPHRGALCQGKIALPLQVWSIRPEPLYKQ